MKFLVDFRCPENMKNDHVDDLKTETNEPIMGKKNKENPSLANTIAFFIKLYTVKINYLIISQLIS